jgi:hypothetical protein
MLVLVALGASVVVEGGKEHDEAVVGGRELDVAAQALVGYR